MPSVIDILEGASLVRGSVSAATTVGARGPAGPQGAKGPAGPQGAKGATGPQGAKGLAGPQGVKGLAGATGAQGLPGAAGAKGDAGDAGDAGTNGVDGAAGATGAIGPQGLPGATTGATGATGATGDKGDRGGFRSTTLTIHSQQSIAAGNGYVIIKLSPAVLLDEEKKTSLDWWDNDNSRLLFPAGKYYLSFNLTVNFKETPGSYTAGIAGSESEKLGSDKIGIPNGNFPVSFDIPGSVSFNNTLVLSPDAISTPLISGWILIEKID